MVDDPEGHAKRTAALEPSKTTTSRVVEANSPRTSEDPGDAMDDDARHPDEPTEPPDNAKSARVRGGQRRVEVDVSRMLRGRADKTVGSDSTMGTRTELDSDEGVPGSTEVDPEDPGSAMDRREDVEVEPGGKTEARRTGSIAHKDVDVDVDREVGEMR